jgi:hypothetical protein
MAKAPANSAARRVSKKVRKNIADGIAHVHASFNNTIITITDRQGNACPGLRRVVKASRVRASPRRSLPRWPLKWQVALLKTKASRTSMSRSRVPALVASRRFVHWLRWASGLRRSLT